MAHNMNVSLHYATHLPALMRALALTDGPVLELGMGVFSTPFLHYECLLAGRLLISYDNNAAWAAIFKGYESDLHKIRVVADWKQAEIYGPWAVALVDHSPSERRVTDIRRLADMADIIVAHDANGRYNREYHYRSIYPLFRYRTTWDRDSRHTVVLSNFVDLEGFWG